jgi:hypothetical protein
MDKQRFKPLAMLVLLGSVGAMLSCNCLCGKKVAPTIPPKSFGPPPEIVAGKPWNFVVSGDSRNCGDVVMPAIAQGADHNQAQFYWHLGDLRAIYDFDDDMKAAADKAAAEHKGKPLDIITYEKTAWDDFDNNQIAPFGKIPFRIGIGNHETIPPKSRCEFAKHFASLLDAPGLERPKNSSPKIDPDMSSTKDYCPSDCTSQPKTYYHWTVNQQVDFIYLDNASECEFDKDQLAWFKSVIDADVKDEKISSIVVGMHAALPESISRDHSMNEWLHKPWPQGKTSGEDVYQELLQVPKPKNVYVLASHSHYVMENIFNTYYWGANGGKLYGWIIGTAGARRYPLPPQFTRAKFAKTHVYGYLLGIVDPTGVISFKFEELTEQDIPQYVTQRYPDGFVHKCFVENREGSE